MKTRMTLTALVALLSMVLLTASSAHAETVVVADENFNGGTASGWNDNSVETSNPNGNFTAGFLGRHAGQSTEQLYKTFALPSGTTSVDISFDFYEIDSWDGGGDQFKVYIDNSEVYAASFRHGTDEPLGGPLIANNSHNTNRGFSSWSDQFHSFSFTGITPASSAITLGFGAFTTQGLTDESMGIDNVHITASGDSLGPIVPLPPPATLNLGSRTNVTTNNANFNISLFDGKARYDNTGTSQPFVQTQLGDGTVEDYNLVVSRNGATDPLSYASGGAGLTPNPYDPNPGSGGWSNNNGQNWANVWTISDPDTDPKDFTSGAINTTHAGHAEVQGTVDISGFESGTLYFPHGTYINQWALNLVMSGPGQPNRVARDAQTSNGPGTNYGWITDFTFTNPGLRYDTITYTYTNADADGSRARFMGVILDGTAPQAIPEPMTMLAVGLSVAGLGGYVRKRRRS